MSALKACPFCGCEEVWSQDAVNGPKGLQFSATVNCPSVGCYLSTPMFRTEAEAVAAWNRRTKPGGER